MIEKENKKHQTWLLVIIAHKKKKKNKEEKNKRRSLISVLNFILDTLRKYKGLRPDIDEKTTK